jgi:hypothetical protein
MSRLTERAGLLGLAGFLVVDVLLVAFALNSTRSPVAEAGTRVGPGVAVSSGTPSTRASAASGRDVVDVVPLTVGIVALDDDTALRFTTGSCKTGGSSLELSGNGGKAWGRRAAPFDTIMRVRVRPDGSAFVIGADTGTDCGPVIRQTDAVDGDFGRSTAAGDVWYRDPRAATSVGLPTGRTGKPCGSDAVVDLAVVDAGAAALCADGQLVKSSSGLKWDAAASVDGALAIAWGPEDRTYAVVPGLDSCAGLAVVEVSKPSVALGCVEVDLAGVEPGTVALAVTATSGWLVSGDDVYRADGDLTDWRKA